MTFIDPHLHFFALDQGRYDWLSPEKPPYWPDKPAIAKYTTEKALLHNTHKVPSGYVHIEAGFDNAQPWREIQFLTQHCTLPFKAVAVIDLLSPDVQSHIAQLAAMESVVGVRHILDDDAPTILAHPKAKHSLHCLAQNGLMFEAQLNVSNREGGRALIKLLEAIPLLKVTINHAGFPPTDSQHWRHWLDGIRVLSRFENLAIKLSGWEMNNRDWQWQQVKRVTENVLEHTNPRRVMFASNFPLCCWRMPYSQLWSGYEAVINNIAPSLTSMLLHDNAQTWYKVGK